MAVMAHTFHYHDEQSANTEFGIADAVLKQCLKASAKKDDKRTPVALAHYHGDRLLGGDMSFERVQTQPVTSPAIAGHYHDQRIADAERDEAVIANAPVKQAAAPAALAHYHEAHVANAAVEGEAHERNETTLDRGASPFDYHEARIAEMDPTRDATAAAWFGPSVLSASARAEHYAVSLARELQRRGDVETKRDEREWGIVQKRARRSADLTVVQNVSI